MEIIVSKDGSNTIFSHEFDEFYHSPRGAVSESKYVYIQNGLEEYVKINNYSSISIFELGFGTGLNTLLTWEYSIKHNLKVDFTSIEKFPLDLITNLKLNFSETNKDLFQKIINSDWNIKNNLDNNFTLTKCKSDINEYFTNEKSDIIFFDAFAKSKQDEIWSDEIINKVCQFLKPNGIFVTYASTTQLKKQLKSNNFSLIKKKGALGKREMTFAIKKEN